MGAILLFVSSFNMFTVVWFIVRYTRTGGALDIIMCVSAALVSIFCAYVAGYVSKK